MAVLPLDAVLFDLDGVLTRTARVHLAAWTRTFDELLERRAPRAGEELRPFTPEDYRAHVDGRPRFDGIRTFLKARGIELPEGSPTDGLDADTVYGLGRRKNARFQELLEALGVEVDPAGAPLLRALREAGVRVAVCTSSKNGEAVIERAGLSRLLDARIDGITSEELGLAGKPAPDIFLTGAERVGARPARSVVLEDAAIGVEAGRRGGFGLVIGVDASGESAEALREAGAHLVVRHLGELSVERVRRELETHTRDDGMTTQSNPRGDARSDGWVLAYEGLDPKEEGLREALCTLGNGNFATRGAAEESHADGTHYPGTYVGGGYNELTSEVAGRTVVNEDLVNLPNWLWLSCRFPSGEELDLAAMRTLEYRQELHLYEGVLVRRFRVEDREGRVTRFVSRRLVHMEKPHLGALEWRVTPENWSGELVLTSGLDGSVINAGVARYRQLSSKHLEVLEAGPVAPEGIHLKARTTQSHLEIAEAARTHIFTCDEAPCERRIVTEPERVYEEARVPMREGEELRVEKVTALYTSRDRGIREAGVAARLAIQSSPPFAALLESQKAAWSRLWHRCDIDVDATLDDALKVNDELVLRLHMFHLLTTASRETVERDVGIPARGLHGEAYRGHVFWDELFILPFYLQTLPSVARSAILYRYHRLDAAREIARQAGCHGASFPWQSGSDGREATQQLHLNPLSGCWDPDHSHLQRHVSAAVVYNVWRYHEATGDTPFLDEYGAEIVLEVARFWSSLAREDPRTGRYDIAGVMGPDEYHEKYPGADKGGLKNNAYTNLTAVWCLIRALDVLDVLSRERCEELRRMLHIDDDELARWDAISRRMTVAFHDGVISQFEGYDDLLELDWDAYAERYGHIGRLDRILKAEGDSPDRYKLSKQADVVMLLYLFSAKELLSLFHRLGYTDVDDDTLRRSVEYYQARTSHGSTLSQVVFTSAIHREDSEGGARLFLAALHSDLYDVQGGTTPEGVHLGAMAGTVDIVTRHYAGLELRLHGACLAPDMPSRIRRLTFRFQHHARWYDVELEPSRLYLRVDDAGAEVTVYVHGDAFVLEPGVPLELMLEPGARGRRLRIDEGRLAGAADGQAGAPGP